MRKKLIYSLLTFIVFILFFEVAARLLESTLGSAEVNEKSEGWQSCFFETFLDWHEPDPELLWRFKADLDNPLIKTNSSHLLGSEMSKRKETGTIRILLLGDSSPVGLGLKNRNQAFGECLKYLLELEYSGNKKIELVNASVSGYTSEQITRFLKNDGWQYNPDLVILYCGNNDASISGNCTDRQLLDAQKFKSIRKLASKLALHRVIRNLLMGKRGKSGEDNDRLTVRVTPEQYEENLRDIVNQCQNHDCPLVICRPPVPLLWPAGLQFKIFRHMKDRQDQLIFPEQMIDILGRNIKYCLDSAFFHDLYGQGDVFTRRVYASAFTDTIPPEEALVKYMRQSTLTPTLLNNHGVTLWQLGRYDEADGYLHMARQLYISKYRDSLSDGIIAAGSPILYNIGINLCSMYDNYIEPVYDSTGLPYAYLDSALQIDFFSLRIKRSYCEKLNKFADMENVSVIDLPRLFTDNDRERLFIDHCHPTADGHHLIAEAIFDEIKQKGYLTQ